MSNAMKQRTVPDDVEPGAQAEGSAAETLTDTRAETNRLFAVAGEAFKSMTEGDSREFLRRSRQTGGQ